MTSSSFRLLIRGRFIFFLIVKFNVLYVIDLFCSFSTISAGGSQSKFISPTPFQHSCIPFSGHEYFFSPPFSAGDLPFSLSPLHNFFRVGLPFSPFPHGENKHTHLLYKKSVNNSKHSTKIQQFIAEIQPFTTTDFNREIKK